MCVDGCADAQEGQEGAIQGGGGSCESPYTVAENQT